jgi:hypothetical protein
MPDEHGNPPSPLIYIEEDYEKLCEYHSEIAACRPYIENKTITGWESPAVYGNIDMDNRQILIDEEGYIETVYAAWSTYVYPGVIRVVVCYSMLQ